MAVVDQMLYPVLRRGVEWLSRNRLPQLNGEVRLPGLQDRVRVHRDRWGVPHIYATNDHDLFFAQGYVQAQDRFWQMEFQRRMTAGRLSEVVGQAGLPIDRWMRILGLRRFVEQEIEHACHDELDILNAFCEGVNAYIDTGRLPVEFTLLRYKPEPWNPVDSLSWVKVLNWYLSSNWECELLRAQLNEKLGTEMTVQLEMNADEYWPIVLDIPDLLGLQKHLAQVARPFTGPGPGEGVGSNNWVVAGSRTATGMPLLANDMHLALMIPAIWYENHLEGGSYRVTGISLVGSPLVVSGHNERVAWGYTAGFADNQDLYKERLRPADEGAPSPYEYEYRGEWLPAEVRQEEILVRDSTPVTQEVIQTHHGPIINPLVPEETDTPLALRWTAHKSSGDLLCVLARMNQAQDAHAFHQAARGWSGPVLNAVYADVDGSIGYSLIGEVPIRAQGDGKLPVEGWTGENEWLGLIPFDELPHTMNPPQGYVATANNRVSGPEYPHFLGSDYVSRDRAERITEMILSREKMDVPYIQEMQFDLLSPSAQSMARAIGSLETDDPELVPLVEMMRRWDGTLSSDSPEAVVYEVMNRQLLALLLENRLGSLLPRYTGKGPNDLFFESIWGHHAQEWLRQLIVTRDPVWFDLGNNETPEEVLILALRSTRNFLNAEFGPQLKDWSWGRMHHVTFQHVLGRQKPLDQALNRGPYPVGGDGSTIFSSYSVMHDPKTEVVSGPPFRMICDLSDLDHCLGLLAPGNSGHPGSPHYDDQLDAWFTGQYHVMLFNREEIEKSSLHCLELVP